MMLYRHCADILKNYAIIITGTNPNHSYIIRLVRLCAFLLSNDQSAASYRSGRFLVAVLNAIMQSYKHAACSHIGYTKHSDRPVCGTAFVLGSVLW